jgi:hypothetical protein
MSRRNAILAQAARIAAGGSDCEEAEEDINNEDATEPKPLGRRKASVPLEERVERRDAPFRPRGDRVAPPRPVPASTPLSTSAREATRATQASAEDASKAAKDDAKLLLKLPESERPMIQQAFALHAPAKVPRAVRQMFVNALAAKKLRSAAGVGAREDVSEAWMDANPLARRSAVGDAMDEERKLHGKATSKVTYRSMSAQLMLRGGSTPKPEPGALKQEYRCAAAEDIDLAQARIVRGDAAVGFFVDACRHRSGNAHPRWLEESMGVDESEESEDERVEERAAPAQSGEAFLRELCRRTIEPFVQAGRCDGTLAKIAEDKVVRKVIARHGQGFSVDAISKRAESICKLILDQTKHEMSRQSST